MKKKKDNKTKKSIGCHVVNGLDLISAADDIARRDGKMRKLSSCPSKVKVSEFRMGGEKPSRRLRLDKKTRDRLSDEAVGFVSGIFDKMCNDATLRNVNFEKSLGTDASYRCFMKLILDQALNLKQRLGKKKLLVCFGDGELRMEFADGMRSENECLFHEFNDNKRYYNARMNRMMNTGDIDRDFSVKMDGRVVVMSHGKL